MITRNSLIASCICFCLAEASYGSLTLSTYCYPLNALAITNSTIESLLSFCLTNSQILSFYTLDYPTLFQLLFGFKAIQTAGLLKISKDNFQELQATSDNTAESLLVCLLLQLLKSGEYGNEKIFAERWRTYIENAETITHILTISLWNPLTAVDDYELPEPDNIARPGDY